MDLGLFGWGFERYGDGKYILLVVEFNIKLVVMCNIIFEIFVGDFLFGFIVMLDVYIGLNFWKFMGWGFCRGEVLVKCLCVMW